jgi:hypothetical protein
MKRSLLGTASMIALAAGAAAGLALLVGRARRPAADADPGRPAHPPVDVAAATRDFLLYFVVPLWFSAGIADWLCHRAADIEHTGGAKESLMHLLMLTEVGVPVIAGLFLEITSPVLALMIGSFLLHEATALWDVSYAVTVREVTPFEQHVHSALEMIPLMALSFVAVLHWPEAAALLGQGGRRPDWGLRRKRPGLPCGYLAVVLAATLLIEWVPYLEELWRCLRASGGRLVPATSPPGRAAGATALRRRARPPARSGRWSWRDRPGCRR